MRIGYARFSMDDQCNDLQIEALNNAGCERIYTDKGISGSDHIRDGLDDFITLLRKGDTLVVWKLDRIGRTLSEIIEFINNLGARGIHFCSLVDNIDTSSTNSELVFHIIATLVEFERSLISERTRAGMKKARDKGKHIGRPLALSENETAQARYEIHVQNKPIKEVAQKYQVSYRTMMRIISKHRNED